MGTSYLSKDIADRHNAKQAELVSRDKQARKWTLDQLRQSDSIIRVQSGSNQLASQRGMSPFGGPRDVVQGVAGLHKLEDEQRLINEEMMLNDQQMQLFYQRQQQQQQQYQQWYWLAMRDYWFQ